MRKAWRAVPMLFTALLLASIVALAPLWALGRVPTTAVRWSLGVVWALAGLWAYRTLERTVVRRLQGSPRVAAQVGLLAGAVLVALVILWLLGVSPGGIAVGGAVTGVVIGLAAQSTLANIFGGFTLMATRPYLPGDHVTLRAAAFAGGEYSGVVRSLNFFYTVLGDGPRTIVVPNSTASVAAITVHASERRRLDVTLPAGCDLEGARRRLLGVVPDAETRLKAWSAAGAVLAVDLPADFSWQEMRRWLDGCTDAADAARGANPTDAATDDRTGTTATDGPD